MRVAWGGGSLERGGGFLRGSLRFAWGPWRFLGVAWVSFWGLGCFSTLVLEAEPSASRTIPGRALFGHRFLRQVGTSDLASAKKEDT